MQSIISKTNYCFFCGALGTDNHHCLMGSKRKACDKYGLTVRLCRKCHARIHNPRNEAEKEMQVYLKRLAQKKFEQQFGSREDFIKIFGRNYL